MLVLPDKKAVVLKLRDPSQVLRLIPSARSFEIDGQALVAVPHRQDETRVLRNLGHRVPAPILSYYDWPGRYTALPHQKITAAFCTMNQRAFVLNDMGTMKTASVLWAADWLRRIGKIQRVLILSPLSTLEPVWADELFRLFPTETLGVVHGTREKRKKILAEDHHYFVVNHHGIKIVEDDLPDDIDLLIVDECMAYKHATNGLWKALDRVVKARPKLWIWMMTGTPMAQSPTDAWALAKLINPSAVPKFFGTFRKQVMHQVNQFKWIPTPDAPQRVREVLRPAIRFSRDQCISLPDTLYMDRTAELTPDQIKAFKQLEATASATIREGKVTAANEGVVIMKLIQVCCGVVYGQNGEHHEVGASHRITLLNEVIEEAPAKVIVFVPLTGALDYVEEQLKDHWTCAVIDGRVSKNKRDEIFRAFQTETDPRVLIAHPETMSHGLNLTEAATVIWYAPIHSYEYYDQANARITRPGQKRNTTIVNIMSSPQEAKIYKRLKAKQAMQGVLFDLFKS